MSEYQEAGVIEPHISLAFTVNSAPGAYAMLLGAGLSAAAGVPTAWGVQEDLITRLAHAQGKDPSDPFGWYSDQYGKPSTYDDLLAALAATREERQALLRSYFEPSEQEREDGLKVPTSAHTAAANLAAQGHVRVFLTTNFDRLLEAALRAASVEPVVVTSPGEVEGMAPLHTIRCLVVHLHGDYLTPASMLNTADELRAYPEPLERLLDRIFDEYGLIVTGWSATWDVALREAWSRCPSRRFSCYWIDPHPLSEKAQDLLFRKGGTYVSDTAEQFLGKVADACQALSETKRSHPASVEVAVAAAKRNLSGARTAIPLHDTIREALESLHNAEAVHPATWDSEDVQTEHARRLNQLEMTSQVALALVATTAYWGDEATDAWWFDYIEQFSNQPSVSGSSALIRLAQIPATMLMFAAGVSAAAAGRWSLVGRLLVEPQAHDPYTGATRRVAELLGPATTVGKRRSSRYVFNVLQPLLQGHLAMGTVGYIDAWERFEYLSLVSHTATRLAEGSGYGSDLPHIRATDIGSREYVPVPSSWLRQQVSLYDDRHPLLHTGLAGGSHETLLEAADKYDEAFHRLADETAWSNLPAGQAGVLPSGTWYPDEAGKWANAY